MIIQPANGGKMAAREVLLNYANLKEKLLQLGCTTGTDEHGQYVTISGNLVNARLFAQFDETNVKIYIRGINAGSQKDKTNLRIIYGNGTYQNISAESPDSVISLDFENAVKLLGNYTSGVYRLYEFYMTKNNWR